MKKLICIFVCLLPVLSLADEYRTFTDKEGRTVKAKIIKVNARSGKMTVEREGGKKVAVPVSVFSEEDQAYVKDWFAAQDFLSPSKFKISVKKVKGKRPKNCGETKRGKARCWYEIVMQNNSANDFDGLELTYRISGTNGMKPFHVTGGQQSFNLKPGAKLLEKTKNVFLFAYYDKQVDMYSNSRGGGGQDVSYNKTHEEKIDGIRVRIYMTTKSGNRFMREECYPKSVKDKHPWQN